MSINKVNYIEDNKVDETLDKKLIEALSRSFTDQPIFKSQRFYKELPQHRWYIEENDSIIAHVALHEKLIDTEVGTFSIAGIAEVFVDSNFRKKGLAKLLLNEANKWAILNDFTFSMLFGDKNIYSSSGYLVINNKMKYFDHISQKWVTEIAKDAMIKPLTSCKWPDGNIDLKGPTF